MRFSKVSFEQWRKDVPLKGVDNETLMKWYYEIKIPQQGSAHSMGVDFFMPYQVVVKAGNKVKIPTGIRWVNESTDDYYHGLILVPRSSVGIKKGMRLLNTVGIVDADYFESYNEGHIMAFMENTTDEDVVLEKGQGFIQGIVTDFKIPINSESYAQRNGGFGSTDNV